MLLIPGNKRVKCIILYFSFYQQLQRQDNIGKDIKHKQKKCIWYGKTFAKSSHRWALTRTKDSLKQMLKDFQCMVIHIKKLAPPVRLSQNNYFLLGRTGPAEVWYYIPIWFQHTQKPHLLIMLFLIQIIDIYFSRRQYWHKVQCSNSWPYTNKPPKKILKPPGKLASTNKASHCKIYYYWGTS